MAVERTKCAACHQTGGRFVLRGERWFHKTCATPARMRDQAKSTFPFTTSHLSDPNDGPVTVQSLRHLRQLETSHGVCSEAYSMDSSNRGEGY
jgi:hypothetical protein